MEEGYETVNVIRNLDADAEGIALLQITHRFDEIAHVFGGDDQQNTAWYKEASAGLKQTIAGVQDVVSCLPVMKMSKAEQEATVAGLSMVALGISRTIAGLNGMKGEEAAPAERTSQIVSPLEECKESIEQSKSVERPHIQALLSDTSFRIHMRIKDGQKKKNVSSAASLALLAALAVITIILTMLKFSPYVIIDAILAALTILIHILSVL
jgi:hypothetical protein